MNIVQVMSLFNILCVQTTTLTNVLLWTYSITSRRGKYELHMTWIRYTSTSCGLANWQGLINSPNGLFLGIQNEDNKLIWQSFLLLLLLLKLAWLIWSTVSLRSLLYPRRSLGIQLNALHPHRFWHYWIAICSLQNMPHQIVCLLID